MPQLSRDLQQQVVKSERDPNFRLWDVSGVLIPEDNLLLYKLNNDFRIYEAIEDDAIFGRLCEERRESPSLREVKVYAGGGKADDELAAEIVRKTIDRIDFDHLCSSLNHAIFTGRSFAEMIWGSADLPLHIEDSDIDRECYVPVKVESKDPARLIFGKAGDDRKLQHHMGFEVRQTTLDAYTQGVALPIRKVIVHSYGSLISNPYGRGVYRRLYWLNNFKKEVLKLGLINSDGRPIPVLTYDKTATPAEIRDAERMLEDFYKNSWMLLPESFRSSFATSFVQGQVASLRDFLTWFDTQASMSILGATLTSQTDNSATRGDSSVHYKVTESRAKSDSDLLSESLKKYFVKPIVELNCPGAALPGVFRDFTPPIDKKKEAEVDRLLFDIGYRPTQERIDSIYGEGYEPIASPTPPPEDTSDRPTTDSPTDDDEDPIDLPDEPTNEDEDTDEDEADLQEWAEFGWIIKRKLNFDYNGYQLSVGLEYLPGDTRWQGTRHARKLRNPYGHVRSHIGADGDSLDAYIDRSLLESDADRTLTTLWAIEQIHPDGSSDELKLVIGAKTAADAIDLYLKEMPQERLGGVRRLSVDELKGMRRSGVEAVRDEDTDEFSEGDFAEVWGVWFSGRRTAILVRADTRSEAIAKARKRKRRGGDGVDSARHLKDWEKKQASGGKWLRSGAKGEKAGYGGKRGFGPKPKNYSESEELDSDWDDIELDEIIDDSEFDVDEYDFDPIDELENESEFAESSPYTKPALRERLKARIKASSNGAKPGQWSARKSQLLALAYRRAGGGYKKGKSPTKKQRNLKKWTKEDWGTKSGKNSTQGKDATGERYLPKSARDRLSDDEYKATSAKKRKGMKEGKQFVPNTKKAAAARRSATSNHDEGEFAEPIALPNDADAKLMADDDFDSIAEVTEADVLAAIEPILEDE